jgi:hypothetical protein
MNDFARNHSGDEVFKRIMIGVEGGRSCKVQASQ